MDFFGRIIPQKEDSQGYFHIDLPETEINCLLGPEDRPRKKLKVTYKYNEGMCLSSYLAWSHR